MPRQEIIIITEESYGGIGILTDCRFSLELKEGGRGRLPRISFGGQVLSLKYLAAKTIQTTSKRRHGLRVGNNGPRSALSLRDPHPHISAAAAQCSHLIIISLGHSFPPLSRLRPRPTGASNVGRWFSSFIKRPGLVHADIQRGLAYIKSKGYETGT